MSDEKTYDPDASIEELRVDFTGVEAGGGFDPIPASTYQVKVTDYEFKQAKDGPKAKNPGAWYINWEFTVQGGEFEGRRLWTITSLLPQALFGLKGLAAATGKFAEGELDGSFAATDVAERIMGSDILAVVKVKAATEEYDARNEIKRFKPVGSDENVSSGSILP